MTLALIATTLWLELSGGANAPTGAICSSYDCLIEPEASVRLTWWASRHLAVSGRAAQVVGVKSGPGGATSTASSALAEVQLQAGTSVRPYLAVGAGLGKIDFACASCNERDPYAYSGSGLLVVEGSAGLRGTISDRFELGVELRNLFFRGARLRGGDGVSPRAETIRTWSAVFAIGIALD